MMSDYIDINQISGISELEAAEKLKREGYNEIPSSEKRNFLKLLIEIIKEPMFILLILCDSVYFILGDIQEGIMLLGFVFVVIGITFYQENKTERALDALRNLSSPRALVIRDGQHRRIPGREVVTGDFIILSEGDRVPADSIVISSSNLLVDESLLTGESMPVRKEADPNAKDMEIPGGEGKPFVYSSTLVVAGKGVAVVKHTGINTEIGKIGKSLQELETEKTQLQTETDGLVKNFAFGAVFLSVLVVVLYGLTRDKWLEGFFAGITLAMSILPEEFPVVLTIFLALGAWRMSYRKVLTRRQHAIQALGSVTVLCVDKTGTLTVNKMAIKKIFSNGKFFEVANHNDLPEEFHELIEFGILASQKEPFDPMEKALIKLCDRMLAGTEHIHDNWTLVEEYPLSKNLLAVSHVWKSPDKKDYVIAAKGAPEAIWDLCHLSEPEIKKQNEKLIQMASEGLRVIAVAEASMKQAPLPDSQHEFTFKFLGLLGFEDPVRDTVPDSIRECHEAGIRVVMITGDYSITAQKIATEIGMNGSNRIVTGLDLSKMTDEDLNKIIKDVNIFARVVPEQKLRIVNALKSAGEIVVMTGDGVNDAPALKSAHIGVAMGLRGTDVAREASSIVVLDDDFSTIVDGIRMGRRIYDNIRKAMAYVLAVHIPIAGITLLAVIFKWPLILLPVHILFLELIIDPACSIVFEAEEEEPNVMKRLPRNPKEKIFNRNTIIFSTLQGLVVLIIIAAIFKIGLYRGHSETESRALCFTTLIIANLCLILTNRSWSKVIFSILKTKNKALWYVISFTIAFLMIVLFNPFLRNLFKFDILHFVDILFCATAGILSIMWFEVTKFIHRPAGN